jgi:WD40 repeat protein
VTFCPDGKTVLLAHRDGAVSAWDAAGEHRRACLPPCRGDGVGRTAFSPGGGLLAFEEDGCVRVYDLKAGALLATVGAPEQTSVLPLALSPGGTALATASYDGTFLSLQVWDVRTGKELWQARGHGDASAAFSPDGAVLAVAQMDASVSLLDPATGEELRRLPRPPQIPRHVVGRWDDPFCARSLSFSPDGKLLAGGYCDQTVHLWEVATAGRTVRLEQRSQRSVAGSRFATTFSPAGTCIASGGNDGVIDIWSAATGGKIAALDAGEQVSCLAFAPDSKTLVSGHRDGTALVWPVPAPARAFPEVTRPGRADLPGLWSGLADPDATRGQAAAWRLAAAPGAAVPFLAERLRPAPAPDSRRVEHLLADLDDDQFAVRERATAELARLGEGARDRLRRALAEAASPEARRRLSLILKDLCAGPLNPSPSRLREIRAIQFLERCNTPEARRLLGRLAGGAPGAALTQDAWASLRRLDRLPPASP